MKFKTAIIGILLAALAVGTTTAVMLILEQKQQTEILLRTADLISLQADMEAYQTITQVDSAAREASTSLTPNEKSLKTYIRGILAAEISYEIQEIRESLGLSQIEHPVYFFEEESGRK